MDPDRGQVFSWGEVAQGLVGTDRVVYRLPGPQLSPKGRQIRFGRGDLVERLGMGSVGPLDGTMKLGRAGWQHEEPDAPRLAGRLELGV